ncbi:sigma-54-dependent transcriptional regulator [Aquisphaera insulae]|uniref:sigma-54-dependent transcriptional regulator n=1 Tax=Aquisphaera insulae TaxID=2712864 RepID=UPI0013E9F07C|nr:sigma-54 dependent transcriptional regulator [Aquisphaera insulae]
MAYILLIDDDPALIPKQVRQAFPAPAYRVEVAGTGSEGLRLVRVAPPDAILLDIRLPDQSGLDLYQAIRGIDGRIPVIFVTLARAADVAIEAMRQGAYDYLFKPLDLQELRRVVDESMEEGRRMRGPASVAETLPDPDFAGAIVGSCPSMREVYKAIGRVSDKKVPVLITGESGTGKELVARAIYQHGRRARAPYRALNCAAIPESLLESELFGHERGAFTGADRKRIGKFEQCNGGTLFLDEIGDMMPALQAKMLRLLQEQEFERVGGNEVVRTDVRLIAATHRDLRTWAAEGKFRPDLYYRLSVVTIHLPPLRERGDDLSLLVQLFLRRYNLELGRDVREVAPEAMDRLRDYPWPGNVRELQSVLQRALLKATGTVLVPDYLPDELFAEARPSVAGDSAIGYRPGSTLADLERAAIQQCLIQSGGSRQRTAELLGISTRTLLRKIREYKLDDPLRPDPRTTE